MNDYTYNLLELITFCGISGEYWGIFRGREHPYLPLSPYIFPADNSIYLWMQKNDQIDFDILMERFPPFHECHIDYFNYVIWRLEKNSN